MKSTLQVLARWSCFALLAGCGSLVVNGDGGSGEEEEETTAPVEEAPIVPAPADPDDPVAPEAPSDPGEPAKPEDPPYDPSCVEYHAFGVYDASSYDGPGGYYAGAATVRIERPGKHVIALSAYEATNWTIETSAGAEITAILLLGYNDQNVAAPGDPTITDLSTDDDYPSCGYSLPYNGEGCDTNELLAFEASWAGRPLTSFHGCYQATAFTLGADLSVTSACNVDAGYEVNGFVAEDTCTAPPG